ncbi:Transposon Tf2-6 polyprotein [Glycine soja]|uniref:Transposon Tf2-6 polyprotein n=1 Tax=Glycine soja TaxID=3848 RepID=A0A445LMD2_GLYSO|nr:Transposon Tf2-6 polyprotein [Glycine soja]
MSSDHRPLHIFFFPFLAHGHIIPTVDMAKLFAAKGIKATIITTPINAPLISKAIGNSKTLTHNNEIHIQTIKFPSVEFCVDYRALNTIIVEDRFLFPTINELLDDLGHATWFSKVDLAQAAEAFWILNFPHFQFLNDLERELSNMVEFVTLLKAVRDKPHDHLDFRIQDELLLYKGHIWVNKSNSFILLLLEEYHKSPLGDHMGLAKTLSHLQHNFFWNGMKQDVREYILRCSNYQHTKYVTQKPFGLLQTIPPPFSPWEDMALDFITGMPNYQGATVILLVVDHFSKGAHFDMLPTNFIVHRVAWLFIEMVCKLHGFPRSLILDRDSMILA